ncbi:hypothetical protein HWV62_45440 [Athelia sp. TMB]|nr:hypothetical protein HWV62_45440 [Athelia sp. TMB]
MRQNGNLKSNAFYNPNEARNPPPTNMIERERDSELEKYIRGEFTYLPTCLAVSHTLLQGKYEFRRFIARDISAKPAPEIPRSSTSQFASEGKALPARSASAAPQPTTAPPRADSLSYRPPTAAIPYKAPYKVPSTVQNRSVSQPLPSQQILAQTQPVAPPQPAPRPVAQPQQAPRPAPPAAPIKPPSDNPVWNDLLSLQGGQTASSSLPLQYQTPTQNSLQQQPFVGNAPSFGQQQSNPYAPQIGSLGMGMSASSPFQQQSQQPFSSNLFGQVGQSSAFQSPAFTGMGAGQLGNMSAPSMPFQSSIPPFSQSAAAQQFQASLQSQPQGPSLFQPQPQQSYGQQQQAPYGQQQPSPFGQQPSPMSMATKPNAYESATAITHALRPAAESDAVRATAIKPNALWPAIEFEPFRPAAAAPNAATIRHDGVQRQPLRTVAAAAPAEQLSKRVFRAATVVRIEGFRICI